MIKLSSRRYTVFVSLIIVFLAILILNLIANSFLSELGTSIVEETLHIEDSNVVTTEYEYSGWITLTIEGRVEQDGEFVHDLFYQRTTKPYIDHFRILEIDDNTPFSIDIPPEYNPDNRYQFLYHIGDTPHHVRIRIKSEDIATTSSVFTVEVSSKNKIYKGR